MTAALKPGEWSRKHASCVVCGTTATPHKAHGRCDRCDHRLRYGQKWPAWLGSCVHCGRSKRVVSYRGGGLCKACVRTATVEERRLAGLRFRALKPRKPHPDAIYQEMVREVVMAHGWAAVARVVGTTTQAVKRWANQRNYVPHRFRAKLRRMWEGA